MQCRLQNLLVENAQKIYPEKASVAEGTILEDTLALGLIDLFEDISMDDRAYRAVSEVIADYHLDVAEDLCQKALQLSSETGTITERCKIWILLTNIRLRATKLQESQQAIQASLEYLQNETVPVPIKQEIWITKALVETKLGDLSAAAASYRGARAVDPSVMVSGEYLVKELAIHRKNDDKHAYISTIKTWTPLERLTWLAWNYTIEGEVRQAYFRDCATALNEKNFIVSVYQETVHFLDNINASAPLKLDLALVYLQVLGDIDSGLKVLDEVFETSSNGWAWAITNEDPQLTLLRAINIITDALFEQFYQSKNPTVKLKAFETLKGLLQKTFAICIPVYSPLVLLNYHITLATMCLKLRQATEFQSLLQSVIDSCFVALNDKVGWNDGRNMMELGRAVAILAKAIQDPVLSAELQRYARIMISAIFSRLDPTLNDELTQQIADVTAQNKRLSAEEESRDHDTDDEPDDEGDLVPAAIGMFTCDGACRPVAEWAFWGKQAAWCCMTCSVTLLCEPCHAISQAGTSQPRTTRYFCGQHHDYVKLPIEGWRGVRDGKFMLAGEEPVSVDDFYDGLKKKVEEAWNEFWSGA
jgi:tetratricopeptide (TPR) repeat protein